MIEILGTLGPSCSDVEVLERMLMNGMTGIRLNMSHTSLSQSSDLIENFWKASNKVGVKADLLIDLQGPEIRTETKNESINLEEGSYIIIGSTDDYCADINVPDVFFDKIEIADEIIIEDGKMSIIVENQIGKCWRARVLLGGELKGRKNIKIIGKNIYGPILTKQDTENIKCIREYGVTSVMQPFVRSSKDIKILKNELEKNGLNDIRVFAKIENREGIKNIENIVSEADMIVIARGDLGNDIDLWDLPAAQKNIEKYCTTKGKPFLVVTQMLTSMINSKIPTRAEVSDIFNAVVDGASAVMVTNETAIGKYPDKVISYLAMTAKSGEKWLLENKS